MEIDAEKQKYVIDMIKERLPNNAKTLILSLTGSRAFGWSDGTQDYDIHGIFICDNYWDWVHDGSNMYDINLYELNHVYSDILYQHFEEFMNFSNPFYVDDKFDFNGLMSFCTLEGVKQKHLDIQIQINRFKFDKAPRTALHAYRILMVPLYFIENRKFQLDIFKINEQYGFTELGNLKEAFHGHSMFDVNKVLSDLEYLQNLYKEKTALCTDKPDMDKAKEWLKSVKEVYAHERQ